MLGATENSSVRGVLGGFENYFGRHASRVSHLYAAVGHRVTCVIEGKVHVLREEGQQVVAREPSVDALVLHDVLPELPFFATGRLRKVLRRIKLCDVRERAWLG